ncbi:MAG: hypothetical protein ACI4EO_07730 [Blautia sp.]
MELQNYQELTLETDIFQQARETFNLLFQKLLKKMEQNNSEEGSITLKVDVEVSTDWVPDGEGGSDEIRKPVLKHKVSTTVPVKDSLDGKKDTGMNLVYDEELKRYVLKFVSSGGQMNIFDKEVQESMNSTKEDERDGICAIEGPVADQNALPGEVLDADYREVEEDELIDPEEEVFEENPMEDEYEYEPPEEGAEYEEE